MELREQTLAKNLDVMRVVSVEEITPWKQEVIERG